MRVAHQGNFEYLAAHVVRLFRPGSPQLQIWLSSFSLPHVKFIETSRRLKVDLKKLCLDFSYYQELKKKLLNFGLVVY